MSTIGRIKRIESMSTATIADIARQAGVGTATVDRVLNKRPGRQRRDGAAGDAGGGRARRAAAARPAARAATTSASPSCCRPTSSPFLELVDRQIAQAAGDFRHQHITEVTHRIDAGDAAQFAAELAQLGRLRRRWRCMAPDLPPVKLAINELVRAGVHVVTLFSDVAGSMRETHVGADNRAAGRTAGLLLGAHGRRPARATRCCCARRRRGCRPRSSAASASRR